MRRKQMNFDEQIESRVQEINDILKQYLPKENGFQHTVIEAMNYSMLAGGKRLRPMLAYEVYRLFEGRKRIIYPFMAALEMIHTYSLIHDDLPAMDNDMFRRGKKTTHVVYGHAIGILAGDGLLNYAFETMSNADNEIDPQEEQRVECLKRILEAIQIISKKSGIYGMVGGQTVDVLATEYQEKLDIEKLEFIYRLKTGALLEAAMETGAILAGASKEQRQKIVSVASDIGLAFQIQDDILDITSTKEKLGKEIKSDEKNQKVTYVTLLGLKEAGRQVQAITQRAIDTLNEIPFQNEYLKQLLLWLIHREK